MSYSHFNTEERISIKHLLAQDVSIRQIAKEIMKLYEDGIIDFETAEFTIMRFHS